jgi:hypothetical protein
LIVGFAKNRHIELNSEIALFQTKINIVRPFGQPSLSLLCGSRLQLQLSIIASRAPPFFVKVTNIPPKIGGTATMWHSLDRQKAKVASPKTR